MGNPAPHRARKRFGQHFLHDHNIIRKLVDAIHPMPGDNLVEIGPGQGALTLPLLKRCQRLTAIELDRDLITPLQQKADSIGELTLINQDILKVELDQLDLQTPIRLVGNLPYNISTPLMFHLLTHQDLIKDMHFMVQKEVALRIVAQPGQRSPENKHYGRLAVMMQYYCECQRLFDVPPGCFSPPPKVDSSIIRLLPRQHQEVEVNSIAKLSEVVQSAFNQRRKTISNSLKNWISAQELSSLDIDPGCRAENLTLMDFAKITNHID